MSKPQLRSGIRRAPADVLDFVESSGDENSAAAAAAAAAPAAAPAPAPTPEPSSRSSDVSTPVTESSSRRKKSTVSLPSPSAEFEPVTELKRVRLSVDVFEDRWYDLKVRAMKSRMHLKDYVERLLDNHLGRS